MRARVCFTVLVVLIVSTTVQAQVGKKIIATGWDSPTPEQYLAQLADVEATPAQGIVLRFAGRGGEPHYGYAFTGDAWAPEPLGEIAEDLKAAAPARPLDNFLCVNANPGDVDWFDDAAWEQIVDHWRIAARLAREGGLRGILFDPEPYAPPHAQFDYAAQVGRYDHSFEEYYAQARERGRAVMAAVAEEYPDIVLFFYFMMSVVTRAADADVAPQQALSASGYGLYPAFIDGWLDVATPEMVFIDGCESAYRFNSEIEYLTAANEIRGSCQRLVSPENRYKYRAQVQVSFGVYLDAYTNPPESPWHIDPGEQSITQRLQRNVETALRVADEYVWVYGEKASWWPTPNTVADQRRWWDEIPGIVDTFDSITDPTAFARRMIAEGATGTGNLLINGSFDDESITLADGSVQPWQGEGPPVGWGFWQQDSSHGQAGWDRDMGAARMTEIGNGCIIQSIPAIPGERYVVGAKVRQQGRGSASIRVRWQTPDSAWYAETLDRTFYPLAGEGDWREMLGVVTVPEGAGRLVLLAGAFGQDSEDDCLWYDAMQLFRQTTE